MDLREILNLTKDTEQKFLLPKSYLRSFGHSTPTTVRTFAACHGFAAAPEQAFAGNFIDYCCYSYPNFNS